MADPSGINFPTSPRGWMLCIRQRLEPRRANTPASGRGLRHATPSAIDVGALEATSDRRGHAVTDAALRGFTQRTAQSVCAANRSTSRRAAVLVDVATDRRGVAR